MTLKEYDDPTPAPRSDTKEPSGKGIADQSEYGKYCPGINQSDIRMSGLRRRNSYGHLIRIICSLGHSFRNE